jgi:hypothetical protein
MLPRTRLLPVLLVVIVWLGVAGPASAVYPPPVKDEAKFFSAEALEKANKRVKDAYRVTKKDLVIETYATVPEGKKVPEEKNKREELFKAWVNERCRDLGVNGVYVLICKSPAYYYIEADRETLRRAFTTKDEAKMRQKLLAALRERKFDEGLKDVIDVFEESLKANLK